MKCPQCGADNQPKHKFCSECGTRLPTMAADPRIELVKKEIPPNLVQKIRLTKDTIQQERKNVSVAFTDISGFTSLSETLDPEELTLLMNDCFKKLSMCVYRYEGIIDKFIGDCIMAIFGAPITHEDDPERAVLACLDMENALDEINLRLDPAIKKLAIHSGINSGEVIAGKIGSDLQMEYTVMGDTVNVAQRLKDIAAPGSVLVGPETYNRTRYAFQYQAHDPVALKGKSESVKTFEVIGRAWGAEFGPTAVHSDLIGRESELQVLQDGCRRLLAGRSSIILIKGEMGVGKSRLLYEFKKYLSVSNAPVTVIDDRGLSYESSIPFKSFADSIYRYLTLGVDSLPADPGPLVRRRVQELLGSEEPDTGPYLYKVLGLGLTEAETDKIRFLDSHSLQLQIFLSAANLFEKIAIIKPAIVIIDDIQWFDSASLELINFMLAGVKNNNITFYLSYRVGDSDPIQPFLRAIAKDYKAYLTEIGLGNLNADDSRCLIQNLTAGRVSGKASGYIIEKSSGNPFFIEEIVRNLLESGCLDRSPDLKEQDIVIPGSIEAAVTARIDALPREAKYLLKIASIIGRSFPCDLLEDIVKEKEILKYADELERAEFLVRMIKDQQAHYAFRHPLFHDVSYRSVLKSERTIYHRIIAEAIEKRARERVEGYYSILAHHFLQAQDFVKAREYLRRAGDEAAGLFSNEEAIRLYGLAWDIAADDRERSDLLEKSAAVQLLTGRIQEARENLEKGLRLSADPQLQASINMRLAKILEITGRSNEAIALYQRILETIRDQESPVLVNLYYDYAAVLIEAQDDHARAQGCAESGIAIAERIHDKQLQATGLRMMGHVLYRQGKSREALAYLERARELFSDLNDQAGLASLYLLTASATRMTGDLDGAIDLVRQAIELFERIGNRRMIAIGHNNLGTYYDLIGDQDRAFEHYEKSLAVRRTLGDPKGEAIAYSNMAIIKEQQLENDAALDYARKALEIMEQLDDLRGIINTELMIMKILLGRNEIDEARRILDRAQEQGRTVEAKLTRSDILHDAGLLLMQTGDLTGAAAALDEALAMLKQETDAYRTANILLTRTELALQRSDQRVVAMAEEALAAAQQSHTISQGINARRLLGLARVRGQDRNKGIEDLKEALRLAEQYRITSEIAHALADLGETLADDEGRRMLQRALELYRHGGMIREIQRVETLLAGRH